MGGGIALLTRKHILIEKARVNRDKAERARHLAEQMHEPAAIDGLLKFAADLERRATELELRASQSQ
jgi:hypothetical protein